MLAPHARLLVLLVALAAAWPAPSAAVGLLRDAGSEHALDELARPLFTAAGLPARRTRVLIVNDMSMNAFVADRRTVFVHAGLIVRLRTAEELQAVIAHEIAHISNGHFARRRLNMENARRRAMAGLALGVAAGAASGEAGAALGIAAGSYSSAMNAFLSHTREEEAAADKSGMHYLALAGIDPGAMGDVLSLFEAQAALQGGYTSTHPLTRDRLRAVETTAARLDAAAPTTDPEIAAYWFDRLKAKLSAYLRSPSYTFRRYDGDDSDAGRIAHAMAHFKNSEMDRAQAILAELSEARPDDPFLPELRGWMHLEAGNPAAALPHYERAVDLAPRQPQILAGHGRALLALDGPDSARTALGPLEAAYARDRRDPRLLRDLSIAYARTGQTGKASLATAEGYALRGTLGDAEIHARRAADTLPRGSPGWARAQDILRDAETSEGR